MGIVVASVTGSVTASGVDLYSYDLATTDTLAFTTGMTNYPGKGSPYDERSPESQIIAARKEMEEND